MRLNDVTRADNEVTRAFHPMDRREEYLAAGYWGVQTMQ